MALLEKLDAPFGAMFLTCTDEGLVRAGTRAQTRAAAESAPRDGSDKARRHLAAARRALEAYIAGDRDALEGLALAPKGTPFQQRVWSELRRIPIGTTTTYGEIARRIGQPTAVRAVGLANGSNPICIFIPCHRVIGSNGSLTGYGGGLPMKEWLLRHEGALL